MSTVLKDLWKTVIDILYPPHCIGCGVSLHNDTDPYLCGDCKRGITYIRDPRCARCGVGLGPYGQVSEGGCIHCRSLRLRFDGVFSAVIFQGAVKELIHHYKYQNKEFLISPLMDVLLKAMQDCTPFPQRPHWLIPVPLHWRKKMQRGFNQSELLAQHLSRHLGVDVLSNSLYRIKNTQSQISLSATQREENVKGAFHVKRPAKVKGKTIILVDDVLTTGLTASECARALKSAGAEKVYVLSVARAIELES